MDPVDTNSINLLNLIIIPVVAVTVIGIAMKVQQYYQKKQLLTDGLVKVFEILGNDQHRQARDKILERFDLYENIGGESHLDLDDLQEEADKVMRDFDLAGALVLNDLAAKKPFMQVYSHTVIRTWRALRHRVNKKHNERKDSLYVKPFEDLYESAYEYWSKRAKGKQIILSTQIKSIPTTLLLYNFYYHMRYVIYYSFIGCAY